MTKVSVVIPVYNAKRTINQCMNSLIQQSYKDYEIIFIDNGSDDDSFEIIEKFIKDHPEKDIKLVKEKERGTSPARNRGIKESSGEILAFTDSDCVADNKWLEDIVNAFNNASIGGVAGNIRGYEPKTLVEQFLFLFTLQELGKEKVYTNYTIFEGGFPTANLTVCKKVLIKAGGFKGKTFGEDHDLCARIYKEGYRIKYITTGLVYHIHRNKVIDLIKQSFHIGESHARFLKLLNGPQLIVEFPKFTVRNVPFIVSAWVNLNNADKKMVLLAITGCFSQVLFLFPLMFFLYLVYDMNKKCRVHCIKVSIIGEIGLVFFLLIKSVAMSFGKIYGSFQERVICL